ncbi:MAG: NAD(P)/FAD-dependent oxidoreductase [Aureliella sp.]
MSEQPHVVVLGAGFAGLGAIKKLHKANVRITLLDKNDYHTFQPLLYQVATAELAPSEISFPLRDLLHKHPNLTFHQTQAESIDLAGRQVHAAGIPPLAYDYLVVAPGAVVNYFDTPGAQEHALPLYTMEDALRLKAHILTTLETIDKQPTLIDSGALNFCIVGGGPTGVEVAGALIELLQSEFKQDYPNLPIDRAQVLLYEHSPHLLGPFLPELRAYAEKTLRERGVGVHTGTGVSKISATGIELSNGEQMPTRTLIWAAGLQANPIVQSLGVPLAHGGRVPVGADLQLAGHPGVFAIGDIAAMADGKTGALLPGLGAVALQAGHHVGDSIRRLIDGKTVEPFAYFDKGTMATVGRSAAVAQLPLGITLTGLPAWLAWLGVHLTLLSTDAERNSVFVDWGWNLLTKQRSKRTLLGDNIPQG